ncbi:hypothetical protein Xen7305DRAFT_00003650 [Xenococcus sp. PCC 7305]|uniref:hypothetical protein n=1 Tax=Xenococcus sp. PCC 7305 TaxID=102125 RepID=UPI0002AC83D3|nr:hypothetical protein [Xenococcus sp. PCC 7305]ELS00664.1 hypothetical protein Xen7305DRAFT_00003650 [Xenococcus sp. PCC 7305]
MIIPSIMRTKITSLLSLSLAWGVISTLPAIAQESTLTTTDSPTTTEPAEVTTPYQSDSLLSLQGGQKLMSEASDAIDKQQYDLAVEKLQAARQVFNQLSNFYLQLSESFSGIENRIAQEQRDKALETGQLRDEATYKLALVHRAQEKPELSVPLLIQVIRSQNPTSDLGTKSYQQLFEIGFVEDPYSTSNSSQ